MAILAEQVDGVIGVDTHRDTLAAAAVSPIGAVLKSTDAPANARGYRRLLEFARQHIPGRRCWAVEGIGSYGAGLAAFLRGPGPLLLPTPGPHPSPAQITVEHTPTPRSRRVVSSSVSGTTGDSDDVVFAQLTKACWTSESGTSEWPWRDDALSCPSEQSSAHTSRELSEWMLRVRMVMLPVAVLTVAGVVVGMLS
ncbi:hypothetical protein [Streptomyces sp. 900105245]